MFETPMIWREPQNHHDDCYFCVMKINGINPGNRNKWSYPNLPSAQRPQLKSREITSQEPQLFNQKELSDLVRDLNLPKEASEILASRLKEKKMLTPETNITFYRTREKICYRFFSQEKDLVFCNDVDGLLQRMGLKKHQPSDWCLFIDSSN
ncbi:uncharacterized protein TNCV_1959311 [Trichonephila clavipes]|nr:uncharacterized protein TNCV_1959311 [Trichonephila clavipes]